MWCTWFIKAMLTLTGINWHPFLRPCRSLFKIPFARITVRNSARISTSKIWSPPSMYIRNLKKRSKNTNFLLKHKGMLCWTMSRPPCKVFNKKCVSCRSSRMNSFLLACSKKRRSKNWIILGIWSRKFMGKKWMNEPIKNWTFTNKFTLNSKINKSRSFIIFLKTMGSKRSRSWKVFSSNWVQSLKILRTILFMISAPMRISTVTTDYVSLCKIINLSVMKS